MATPKMISLKLFVDKKGQRVLFAEAPKEFVDVLFHLFSLPLGTLISLPLGTLIEFLGPENLVGCLGKLKDNIESFHQNNVQPAGIIMDDIFNPKAAFNQSAASTNAVYKCPNAGHNSDYDYYTNPCESNATLHKNSICPDCGNSMVVEMNLITPKEVTETKQTTDEKKKEAMTYMLMDDLSVKPVSTVSSITLLNKFGVNDLSQVEEKTISFSENEGFKLLMASLKTDKVLTTIFLH